MNVRTKLIVGFSVIVILLWMIAFFVGMGYRNLQQQFMSVEDDVISDTLYITNVESLATETYRYTLDYMFHGSEEAKLNTLSLLDRLEVIEETDPIQNVTASQGALNNKQQLIASIGQFRFAVLNIIRVKESGASFEDLLVMDQIVGLPALLSLQQSASILKADNGAALAKVKSDFNRTYYAGLNSIIASLVVITLIGLLAAILTTRSIITPLNKLRKGTEVISQGNLDYKVGTKAKDEIGQLSRAFDQMTEGLTTTMTSVDNLNAEIDERKRAEEALVKSEEKFRILFEYARDSIFLADAETGIIIDVNPAGCKLIGLPKEKIVGMHQSRLHPEGTAEKYKELFCGHVQQKNSNNEDMLVQRADGTQVPVDISANLIELDGKPTLQGVFRDITLRKQAQAAIHESEEKFSKAFRSSPHPMSISTLKDGRFIDVNDSFTRIIGYQRDEVIGKSSQELKLWIDPKDRVRIFEELAKEGRVVNEEFLTRVKSGDVHTMLFSAETIKVSGDDCLISITTDITDRRKAEEDLKASQEYSNSLLENSPHQFLVINPDTSVRYVNPQFEEVNGWTLDEVVGLKAPYPWWPDEVRTEEAMEGFKEAIKMESGRVESPAQKKNGEIYWLDLNWVGVEHEGELQYCLINSMDITERKNMEEALKTREERFSDIAENTLEWIWEIDTDGKYTYSSPVIEKILGYTPEEIIGTHFYDLFHPEDRNKLKKAAFKAFAQKQPFHDFVNRNIHKNGRTIVLSTSGVPILDADGNLLGYRGVDTDITERKKRDQLQQDENYVLTLLGQGAELGELLDAIVYLGEDNDPSIKGSILLYDPDKNWLNVGSGPNLPEGYSKLMESGIPIGDNMGSCGTAAYRKERVIVPDIAESPFFKPLEEVVNAAVGNNLLACWSQHILSSNGDLLGTIANYSDKIGEPNADNIKLLEWSARIAAIAIERKQAEEALQESEDKFSKAFRSSPNTIVITTLKEGRFIEVNDSFTELTGYTREEVIGQSAKDLHIWADTKDRDKMLKILKRDGRVRDEEFKFRIKSGEIRTWSFSAELIDIKNEPHMISMTIDITELKRAEQATKDSEEKFSKAFHSSPAAISISLLDDGSFIEVNDSYTRITGHSREELIGHNAGDFNIWVNTKEKNRMLDKISNRQKITNEEFDYRLKSGEIRTMLVSNEYLTLNGKPCVLVANTDITERKRTEEKLKNTLADLENSSTKLAATNKELETFSYSVSHDLRSPLRSIDGFSQALLEDYQERLDDTGKDYLQRLRSASQKMGELIDGILKLSRLNRGEMHKEEIDLSALVGEISARLQENEPQRHAKFLIKKGLVTQGDPQLLRALIENLIGNSWKFTRKCKETKIEFGTSKNGGETTYFIKDNGAGFDMTYADKLFGAFQRLHDVSEYPGTGIGLATVQRIINRHGGNIWAEGAVDKGATFYFTLN